MYGGPTAEQLAFRELEQIQIWAMIFTFDLLFDGFGWIKPVTDMVMVCVLQPEVVLLYDIHLIVDLLQQFLTSCFFLQE